MHLLRCFFLLWLVLFHPHFLKAAPCDQITHYIAENLEISGTLEQTANGFVCVKVDDNYIYQLHHFIKDEGFEIPPYFTKERSQGAHITVMYSREVQEYHVGKIDELGSKISFRITGCQIVQPTTWDEVTDVYLVTVDSPALTKIRKKYGLPKAEYNFHITIGVKHKKAA